MRNRQMRQILVLVLISFNAADAFGQNISAKTPQYVRFFGTPIHQIAPSSSIPTAFESRWKAHREVFVLGTNGQIEPARGALNIETLMHHSAYPLPEVGVDDVHSYRPSLAAKKPTAHARSAPAQAAPNRKAAALPECGPSPLTPGEIRQLVEETARRNRVDPAFAVAIASAESSFDRERNSRMGARGPMQLMPATAARFHVEDVCDPADNIRGGVGYLRALFNEFGNPLLVAAAYNAGKERVYQYGGIPPFHETVGYVAKVMNARLGLRMPAPRTKSRIRPGAPGAGADEKPREVGVIEVKKTGTFVGGVMQF